MHSPSDNGFEEKCVLFVVNQTFVSDCGRKWTWLTFGLLEKLFHLTANSLGSRTESGHVDVWHVSKIFPLWKSVLLLQ